MGINEVGKVPLRASSPKRPFTSLIMKITISSIVIGLKNSFFPLIRLPSC